jgi:glycosyltransferase involved in cell wall biosynthesis
MKIVILQDRLRSGGTERQSILLTRAFIAAGEDASLVTFRPGGALAASASDLPRHVLQPFDLHLDWFGPGVFSRLKRQAPSVVLCMGRMANCYAGGLQQHLSATTAVIATMRTGKHLPWLFRRSLPRVRHIVANSRDAREALVATYGVSSEKISVIHNSLVFPPAPAGAEERSMRGRELRAKHGAGPGTVVLLWVGMFRPEKNQRELIELLASLPADLDWQLWFGGDGPTRSDCEALVAARSLGTRVKFLGFQADPTPLYAAANVAVLTSRSESLSNFLIEAHAHGLPSVAYRAQGVDECGGRSVELGQAAAFREALLPFLRDPEQRRIEGARVEAYARDHFSPQTQVRAYLDLFQRLVRPAPSA